MITTLTNIFKKMNPFDVYINTLCQQTQHSILLKQPRKQIRMNIFTFYKAKKNQ